MRKTKAEHDARESNSKGRKENEKNFYFHHFSFIFSCLEYLILSD